MQRDLKTNDDDPERQAPANLRWGGAYQPTFGVISSNIPKLLLSQPFFHRTVPSIANKGIADSFQLSEEQHRGSLGFYPLVHAFASCEVGIRYLLLRSTEGYAGMEVITSKDQELGERAALESSAEGFEERSLDVVVV